MGYPYAAPYGLYQPPPPPPHPGNPMMDPNIAFNGLTVTDPRFAAKYGNPYLRAGQAGPDMGSPQMNPRNYPYATLNRGYQQAPSSPNLQGNSYECFTTIQNFYEFDVVQGYSTGQRVKKANVNYTGTMVGNGKVNSTSTGAVGSSGTAGNGKVNGNSQYIVSPESDNAKGDVTHV